VSHFLPISPSLNLSNLQKFYPLLSAKSASSAFPFSSNQPFTKFIKPTKILSPFIRQIRVIRVPIFVQSGLYKIYQTPKNFIPFYPPNPRHPRSHFLPINPSLNLSNPQKFYPLLSAKSSSSAFPFSSNQPFTKFIKPTKILSPFIRQIRVIRVPFFHHTSFVIPLPVSHFLPISPSLNLSNPQKFYPLLSAKSASSAFPFFTIHPLLSRYPCLIFVQSALH